MKRIFAQKFMFYLINAISLFIAAFAIVGGILIDSTVFYALFISLFFSLLSLLCLINRIYFNDTYIEFKFVAKKLTIKFDDIKEIYVQDKPSRYYAGIVVVFNFERALCYNCDSAYQYLRKCANEGITGSFYASGLTKKDFEKIIQNYNGIIKYNGIIN